MKEDKRKVKIASHVTKMKIIYAASHLLDQMTHRLCRWRKKRRRRRRSGWRIQAGEKRGRISRRT